MRIEKLSRNLQSLNVCVLAWSVYEIDARVRKYAEYLVSEGATVDVICLSPPWRPRKSHGHSLNSVNVLEVARRVQEKSIVSYACSLLKYLVISFWRVTLLSLRKRYDLVHVHSIPDFEVFAAVVPKLRGARIILDIHDPMPDFFAAKFKTAMGSIPARLLLLAERLSSAFADHVITVTEYWRMAIARRSGVPPSKISVIVNLPDLKLFDITKHPKPDRTPGEFVLLYPGTLNKHCGLDVAVKAVNIARQTIPGIRFDIYGKGSEVEAIRSLVKALRIENAVSLHEPVPWDTVPELMAASDAGIALLAGTDTYAQHALNVKIFEFLAMGLPVIATRTSSTESHLDEKTVLFSKPNAPEDVARAIIELGSDSRRRSEFVQNGLHYTEQHNWNSEMDRYRRILVQLTGSKPAAAMVPESGPQLQTSPKRTTHTFYYFMKPVIPRALQIGVRRRICAKHRRANGHVWPIDPGACTKPAGWNGWPEGKQFALVLTHDVESRFGPARCGDLMEFEKRLGFRSSFNFVTEDYPINQDMFHTLRQNGFEVGVHGLHHNGNMYRSRRTFDRQARRINRYLREWQCVGFRSPTMRHNLEWIHDLNILYDASTFDTDPFEPQPDGMRTIFPFWVSNGNGGGYVELPYTLPQDFTLFVLLKEKSIDSWKRKLDWIVEHGGMALLIAHPDYMSPTKSNTKGGEYPISYYRAFLEYILENYRDAYWNALPREVASLWMQKYRI